ncbi:MAG: ABC transporter ATP-binding protein [Ilumatobacteraceae bacterium]|nr:MAG: ABC transporter ATP-binding protein [Actinomycetota bacterium]
MIHVEKLFKRYGKTTVVSDISFDVAPGEAVALWGPNGAGKSTVMKCILGAIPYEGKVEVGGFDARRRGKAARQLLGYVPQHLAFYDDLTVGETVALSTRLRRVALDRGREVLGQLGLGDEWGKRVGALSGGMKQRLGIALALVSDPPVLLLDEPTSSLDVAARRSVLEVFESLRDDRRAIVLTSHHLDEVGVLADRVLAMDSGQCILESTPGEFAERLGLRVWLHVMVVPDELPRAVEVLSEAGYAARRNSRGLLVEVGAGEKGQALNALQHAGMDVIDVDVWR